MDSNTALDITQETFLKLWKQLETGEELKNPRAWLLRVARNLADDWAKSAFRRHGTQSDEYLNTVARPGNAPLEEMVREEGFARIRAILDELPTGDREILTLRYALDYDSPKIAEILGVPVTAIHMRLSRARQRMAELLAAHGVQNPS
jgi:RNA polymerase sigma-70 factor (ECF subfamily)